ncbi:MAG: methyltransferase domain-containing protein [Ruminiclostridium sp.]|nr:methyltransferase domain-containing protein [Ruminiclostridium sp.]
MESKNSVWDLYAPVYDLFMRVNRPAYMEMYGMIRRAIKGKTVLEIAAGTGLIAKNVADAAESMIATDVAENLLARARTGYVPHNLDFRWADATFLPFDDDRFDVVIIANALHIVDAPRKVLAEIRRVLKPGGRLIAPNFLHAEADSFGKTAVKLLGAAGIKFENDWDEKSYERFIEGNGFNMISHTVLKAMIPLMYAECEMTDAPLKKTYSLFDRLPDMPVYGNPVPGAALAALGSGTGALALTALAVNASAKRRHSKAGGAAAFALAAGALGCGALAAWSAYAHVMFSDNGPRKLSRHISEGIAKLIDIPDGGRGLDIGCGSGALTIACAKRCPGAIMTGIDFPSAYGVSSRRKLFEYNAGTEGVSERTEFVEGRIDELPFEDETFDAVTGSFPARKSRGDLVTILSEALRTLKKGGVFAIHDIVTPDRTPELMQFMQALRDAGYEKVELIDTTGGLFMTRKEASALLLKDSAVFYGKK